MAICRTLIVVLAGLCASPPLSAADMDAALKRGDEVVKSLPKPKEGFERTIISAAVTPDTSRPIGYAIRTVRAVEAGRTLVYQYDVESVLDLPNGTRVEGGVTAIVDAALRPGSIRMSRTLRGPSGLARSTLETLELQDEKLILSKTERGRTTKREIPVPAESFIFSNDLLMMLLDLREREPFAVRELNPQTGKLSEDLFETIALEDGMRGVEIRESGRKHDETYLFDAAGRPLMSAEAAAPIQMRVIDEEQAGELFKTYGRSSDRMTARPVPTDSPPASQPQRKD